MNKRGFEISINMVIILILAIVTLVVALGFITGFLQDLFDSTGEIFPDLTQDPTPNEPITYAPLGTILSRGRDNKMTIGFYNNEQSLVSENVRPTITCENINFVEVISSGMNIDVGSTGIYSAIVRIPSNTLPGTYPCRIRISNTEKSLFMEVK